MNAVAITNMPRYISFPPKAVSSGKFVVGAEHMRDVVTTIQTLHQEHWDETEVLYLESPRYRLNPDYETYIRMQDNGLFVMFTGRLATSMEMVANILYFIQGSLHDKGMMLAREDAFFVSKPYRQSRLAIELLTYAESCLKALGVDSIGMTDKSPCGGPDLSKFLGRRGYKPVAVYYLKNLE